MRSIQSVRKPYIHTLISFLNKDYVFDVKISALATCHNRANMTLQALDSILNQQFLSKDIERDVCLV